MQNNRKRCRDASEASVEEIEDGTDAMQVKPHEDEVGEVGEVLVGRCRGSEEGAVGEGNMVDQEALESREEP